ncbi:flavoprotein [Aspergillus granulosus]|uniref:Flavoprotein n=1 Tax=Aspergillus granulosus TaxID=176169 RepID=A0ABR4HY32_9EURO
MAAPTSSGLFKTDGMIIIPRSIKTLAEIHVGFYDDLIPRTADVTLKKRRQLILVIRETLLSEIYIRNILEVTRAGAVVAPPVPAFYIRPGGVGDLVSQNVGRLLDLFELEAGELRGGRGGRRNSLIF